MRATYEDEEGNDGTNETIQTRSNWELNILDQSKI